MIDSFGDRMKMYEGRDEHFLMPGIPFCARLDGMSFHTFTRGLKRPYDERIVNMMVETTKYLVDKTNAAIGYTQSDEISLIFRAVDKKENMLFSGRVNKLVSYLTSLATAKFNELRLTLLPEKPLANFDCRVWSVPNNEEAVNEVQWREFDATKNSISMAASAYYSHKQLQGKHGSEKQDMLHEKGINWNDYPAFFKRGTYVKRILVNRKITDDEWNKIPEKHRSKVDRNMPITRHEIIVMDMPILASIENRTDVIFNDAKPILKI